MSVALRNPAAGLRELDRLDCETLAGFVRRAWHVLEPGMDYVHGWHIDAVAEHLTAITDGQISRLLINVPPGMMKSLLVGVLWPAWEWGPRNRPSTRVVATSHSIPLAVRDNLKARRLVQSDWYQALWGDRVKLTGDQNAKTKFENTATGFRDAMAFRSLTGSRGDRVVIDDPHSVDGAESEAERSSVTQTFLESVPTRLNDPKRSAIVVVMQRLHERDVSGVAIAKGLGYEHLCLPMEFEPERRCRTSIGFADPRTEDGELLFPGRFPREVVERDKIPLGSYAVAGQFQQRPVPREGGLFKREWFEGQFVGVIPAGTRLVRHWDLAGTKSATAARTAGVKVGRTPDGAYIVAHSETMQEESPVVRRRIRTRAELDGEDVEISLPQDPAQAGKDQARSFVAMLDGFNVRARPETGAKETRAEPFSAQCEGRNVFLLRTGDPVQDRWIEGYLDELCLFPGGTFKDQVDASANAFNLLARSAGSAAVVYSPDKIANPWNETGGAVLA